MAMGGVKGKIELVEGLPAPSSTRRWGRHGTGGDPVDDVGGAVGVVYVGDVRGELGSRNGGILREQREQSCYAVQVPMGASTEDFRRLSNQRYVVLPCKRQNQGWSVV
jgi:hypothetical protein